MSLALVLQLEFGTEIFQIIAWPCTEKNDHKINQGQDYFSSLVRKVVHSSKCDVTMPQQ